MTRVFASPGMYMAYDAVGAANYAFGRAHSNSAGSCARYVRYAIAWGGVSVSPTGNAKDYGGYGQQIAERLPTRQATGDADYFLKVQDEDEQDWLNHIATRRVVMPGEAAVVPVVFGSRDQTTVNVFMRKIAGVWKMTKVDDTSDYRWSNPPERFKGHAVQPTLPHRASRSTLAATTSASLSIDASLRAS